VWRNRHPSSKVQGVISHANRLNDMLEWVTRHRGLSKTIDDLYSITAHEGLLWRTALEAQYPRPSNVARDHLDIVKGVYGACQDDGKFIGRDNPFDHVPLPLKNAARSVRLDMTDPDAKTILDAALDADEDMRWLQWVECFTGTSHSELADALLRHVYVKDGIACLKVTPTGRRLLDIDGRPYEPELKANERPRIVPLHPIIRDGFLARVEYLRAKYGPDKGLFEEIKPDKYGSRADRAGLMTVAFLRDLGIDNTVDADTGKAILVDAYAWRHRFISKLALTTGTAMQQRFLSGHKGGLPAGVDQVRSNSADPHEAAYTHHPARVLYEVIAQLPDPTKPRAATVGEAEPQAAE